MNFNRVEFIGSYILIDDYEANDSSLICMLSTCFCIPFCYLHAALASSSGVNKPGE